MDFNKAREAYLTMLTNRTTPYFFGLRQERTEERAKGFARVEWAKALLSDAVAEAPHHAPALRTFNCRTGSHTHTLGQVWMVQDGPGPSWAEAAYYEKGQVKTATGFSAYLLAIATNLVAKEVGWPDHKLGPRERFSRKTARRMKELQEQLEALEAEAKPLLQAARWAYANLEEKKELGFTLSA